MKMQKFWYFAALLVITLLPLAGCSGGNGSSITPDSSGKLTASISGTVDIDKSVGKSVGATAGALGKVEVFNAYSSANKAALGTAEVQADGSFTGLNFTLPATQSAVIFKATLTGPPETKLYNITPMDLLSPPAGLASNNVQITINQASTATANAVMTANGATLDTTISPSKAFSAVAASVVANGGYVLSYAGNGIKLTGTVGGSAAKVAESCAVCHGDSKTANVDAAHGGLAKYGDLAISNIVGTVVGPDLQVTFNVKVNGSNKTSYYNEIASQYRLDGTTLNRITLAGTTITAGTNGNYTLLLPGAAANPNSRYLIAIRNGADNLLPSASRPAGYRAMVLLDFPASPVTDVLGATSKSCEDCHGSYGNGFHNGYPAYGGKTCVVCHDAANQTYPRTPAMIHTIHQSGNMPTGKGTVTNTLGTKSWDFAIKFPSYMDNCSICHKSGTPLTAANAKPVNYDFCMTCHQSWDGFTQTPAISFHKGMNSATNCAVCHDGTTAKANVGDMHNKAGLYTERGGLLYNGEDLSVTEGDKTKLTITGVTRTGNSLAIKWTATYDGAAVNPCNATPSATAPSFAHMGIPIVDHGAVNTVNQNFSILKAFFQGDDLVNANNGATSPGQPNNTALNFAATGGNTVCSSNVATTTITLTAKEAALTGKARIALQGKPVMKHTPTGNNFYLRALTPVYDYNLADGAAAPARRPVADTAKCVKCHVGSLYQHGGNRVDNVELCVMCHNEASNEQNVRISLGVTDKSKTYDGKLGQTYGFKSMLHAVHASGHATFGKKPLVIYRSNGIYAFALSEAMLYNWPGTGSKTVVGSDPTLPAATTTKTHNFVTAHYPRPLQDCFACHTSNFSRIPDPTKAVATTVLAGAAPWDNQMDDTLQGPVAAACTSCHSGSATAAHANQFGWTPAVIQGGRQAVIDSAK